MTKAILFDFDGTLANTAPGIVSTMNETFRTMGLPVPDEEATRQTIGLPLVECIRRLGAESEESALKGVDIYRSLFPKCELNLITMFPGVEDTVRSLYAKGIRLGICTSRGRESLKRILSRYDLLDKFEDMVTMSDNITPKPAPDMVLVLLERMGLKAEDVIVVGDTTFDILMGSSAGCRTVAVTYGNHSREQLQSVCPNHIIDDFTRLESLI